ncbi:MULTISPECIES: hypothetical protein [Pseudoalteromonas]|uniref:hypothetical protein n=1 Tax=Pseudoalteromonas TaxID=53246 RepID=UPI001600F622|nr:hypothetical protein [Pseudoalteromonas sp. SG43-6]MBB1436799.1 hypothetical protein [Pseudoalteromonas sp. SG43-6]
MDELKLKYSVPTSAVIAIAVAALNFTFFVLIYKTVGSLFLLGELTTLGLSAIFTVFFTIFVAKPLLKKLIIISA